MEAKDLPVEVTDKNRTNVIDAISDAYQDMSPAGRAFITSRIEALKSIRDTAKKDSQVGIGETV